MSRILILSSFYLGAATANGICAKNIAQQLKQDKQDVFVLCYDDAELEENVYTVACPTSESRSIVAKVVGRVRSVVSPKLNKKLLNEYKALTLELCKEKKIDVIVCCFFPFETIPVITAVKKKFPHIRTIIYELDSVGDGIFLGSKYQKSVNTAIERWCSRQYCYADKVIVMESHEEYWKNIFKRKHGDRLKIADIPVLVEKCLPQYTKESIAPVSFLYGGLIEQSYRSPDHLLTVFEEFSKIVQARFDFFSKGDCEEKIAEFSKRIDGIYQNGYVPQETLDKAIAKADVLVSIGNRISHSVPSKLITYFSYGKPVVHFSSQKDDVCVRYVERYSLGLVLREWDSAEENARKLFEFINETLGKKVEFSEVAKVFIKNTPAYSAGLIVDNIVDS